MYKSLCLLVPVLGMALLSSCNREPTPLPPVAVIDGRDKTPAKPVPPAPAAPVRTAAVPAAAPSHPSVCETEIGGQLQWPKGQKPTGKVSIFVADNDCMAKDAHILGVMPSPDNQHFFIEVFPKWGSDVTVCAAAETKEGAPARTYGTIPRKFHAEGVGEVTYANLTLELKAGPPHIFPRPQAAAPATHP